MPRPIHTVERFHRRTRAASVVASGLTMDAASNLAAALRRQHLADEAAFGFAVGTLTLAEQVGHLAAGEAMHAVRRAA